MPIYVLRVWMPDRPGALGAVASRVGAARGDVVGIEILERGAGRAIDELVVELPDESLLPLLLEEVHQVDGVDIEEVRPADGAHYDPRMEAVETAAMLVAAGEAAALLDALCEHTARLMGAVWAVVIDLDTAVEHASVGEPPAPSWVAAFVAGSRSSARVAAMEAGPDDVLWAQLSPGGCAPAPHPRPTSWRSRGRTLSSWETVPSADLGLVMGRDGSPFRARERRQVAALARVADTRYRELVTARVMSTWITTPRPHPSAGQIGQK